MQQSSISLGYVPMAAVMWYFGLRSISCYVMLECYYRILMAELFPDRLEE